MKKNELKELVLEKIGSARSVNNLIEILKLKSGGNLFKCIKKIIKEENIDISHFGGKIVKEKKYKEIIKKCPVCGLEFTTKEGHKREQVYCSKSCSNKDRIVSEETIQKIRTAVTLNHRTTKENKLLKLIERYGENTIGLAKELKLNGENYDEIRNKTQITDDDLKVLFNLINLQFPSTNFNAQNLINNIGKEKILETYLELKNLKKTAEILNVSYEMIRKHISDDDIIIKKKNITRNESVISWRKRSKIKLVEYKGGECQCCSYKKCISALTFHHKNPKEKDFTIGGSSYSFERLKKEVDKCIMVCSNCHTEIHEEIRNFGYSKIVNNIKS